MNSTNPLGEQFRADDLNDLVGRGHELALHGFSHLSARKVRARKFIADVDRGEEAMRGCKVSRMSRNFAYPYGEVTLSVKKCLGPQMASCRGTIGGLNGPMIDLNLLRANYLYGGIERAQRARNLILENQRRKGWLVFYTHDVADYPSPYGCTGELLKDIASFALRQGATLMPVVDIIDRITVENRVEPSLC